MGWKRLVVLICFFSIFFSCKNYFYTIEGGIRPRKNRFYLSKKPYKLYNSNLIDTNSVYIKKVDINYGNKKDTYSRFYRFFSNGRVLEGTSGLSNDSLTIKRLNDFNNSGVIIGYYKIDNQKKIIIESFQVKKYEGGSYSTTIGFIRNDSIFIEKKNINSFEEKQYDIFKKRKVIGLNGKPDW